MLTSCNWPDFSQLSQTPLIQQIINENPVKISVEHYHDDEINDQNASSWDLFFEIMEWTEATFEPQVLLNDCLLDNSIKDKEDDDKLREAKILYNAQELASMEKHAFHEFSRDHKNKNLLISIRKRQKVRNNTRKYRKKFKKKF